MIPVNYDNRSPYKNTSQVNRYVQYLDFWSPVTIPPAADDRVIKVESKYNNRPDLLAFDLYGSAQLWWIFAARNPDIINDPIYDLKQNITIYVPVKTSMGVTIK